MRGPNIYEMYVANGNRVGFWVQRNSWGSTCAIVRRVGGRTEGTLPGVAPYHLDVAVHGDVYDLSTGDRKQHSATLSCPGTFAYHRIETPKWALVAEEGPDRRR